MTSAPTATRLGGHLVVESLEALGADAAFGLPGIHALAIWEALRTSPIRCLGFRTELNAGFAADGYARASGRPAPLVLSTGPGALNSLTALMEAASSHVPVVAIASQIPRELIGRGRGFLHELRDQRAVFEPVVKWAARVDEVESLPATLAEAWRRALTPPSGPVFVEIPVDVLTAETDAPRVEELDAEPPPPVAPSVDEAAALLGRAERPVIWAGGGVLRSGAWDELAALAERLDAPVATTYMGKGVVPEDHPLSAGSACDEPAFQELLRDADLVLAVGTELGAETTGQYALELRGQVIQIDADEARIGATYPATAVVGDARAALRALAEAVPAAARDGAERARRVREASLRADHELERGLLTTLRSALPRDAVHAWDMTILAYWAAAQFPALEPRRFLYPLGSGTLGYSWPAALGAKAALPDTPALAVAGDGGILYGLQELATAREHGLDAKLLLVDDGGYGILREYQRDAYGETHGVDFVQPDFAGVCRAFGVPTRVAAPEQLGDALEWALAAPGPVVVVLPARLSFG
jgi:acetolactate synthase I/II/III large subunit